MKKKSKLPPGWTEKRVREILDHYEHQSEEEQHAEIEAAKRRKNTTMMAVPTELVSKVRALIAKHATVEKDVPRMTQSEQYAVREDG